MAKLTLGLFQANSEPLNKTVQLQRLAAAAERAADQGVDILITPELYLSGYNIAADAAQMAEPQDGPSITRIRELALNHRLALMCGYPEQTREGIYNSAAIADHHGNLIANYRKLHLPKGFERSTFIAGHELQLTNLLGIKIAPLICYDIEFPEPARRAAVLGAELLLVPTALGQHYRFLPERMIATRAFENGVFVAYVNHAGQEFDCTYCGLSTLAEPDGIVHQVPGNTEELLVVTVDTAKVAAAQKAISYLDDLRQDLAVNDQS